MVVVVSGTVGGIVVVVSGIDVGGHGSVVVVSVVASVGTLGYGEVIGSSCGACSFM